MRRSFDGLHALARDHLQLDPFAGHLYLFANKRRDWLKILAEPQVRTPLLRSTGVVRDAVEG
jgi:hypothetical protein